MWIQELNALGEDYKKLSAVDFMHFYAEGKLTNTDTITRIRRKLQETSPNLRGKKYEKRQARQKDVKKALGYEES